MGKAGNTYAKALLQTESEHLKKLNEIVNQSLEQEKSIFQKISDKESEIFTTGQRAADKIAKFGGSWKFIIAFGILLSVWIIINLLLPKESRFDPYPFILMNLVLSCIAALQAPIIMMSQNRQEEKDRKRNENDYMVNLKAEVEIRTLHQKVDLLIQEQFKKLMEAQAEQLKIMQKIMEGKSNK